MISSNAVWYFVLTALYFHILVSFIIAVIPIASLDFTSAVQSASLLTPLPNYPKVSTCSNFPSSTQIASSSPVFVITFVSAALLASGT